MRLDVIFASISLLTPATAVPQLRHEASPYKWEPDSAVPSRGRLKEFTETLGTRGLNKRTIPINAVLPQASDDPGIVASVNPYTSSPYTGVIRSYDFTLSRKVLAPDGKQKKMIVINGQFPGPMITANWGDTIKVTVQNNISGPEEGTAIHWHGFLQSNTPWADGVPGIAECPIAPGQSRNYTFQAQLYGTSWYHSHFSSQYADGTSGPVVVNGPSQVAYDKDLGPLILSDLYYPSYFDVLENILGTDTSKIRPSSDNSLINGVGCPPNDSGDGSAGAPPTCNNLSSYEVEKGKKYRLRLINSAAAAIQKFSIDDHNMTVIAYDFVAVQPFDTQVITLAVGQRADVVIGATGDTHKSYWIRSNASLGACTEPMVNPMAWAVLKYEGAPDDTLPNSSRHVDTTTPCENDPLDFTQPMFPITPGEPDVIQNIDINFYFNETGHFLWTLDNQTFRTNYNHPPLLLAKSDNTSYPLDPEWNVRIVNSTGSIRVVVNNLTPTSHPMHLHGHNMYILAAGTGTWDGKINNPSNPLRRDVYLLPASGHLVLQWDLDNPGVWPFHCHIAWHVSGGLQTTFIERPDDIANLKIPQTKWGECQTWNAYSNRVVVDQIDSGL